MSYFRQMSKEQWLWLVGSLLAGLAIIAVGWWFEGSQAQEAPPVVSLSLGLREIAPKLDTTGKALARELHLPIQVPMDQPLAELGVEQSTLDHAVAHLWSHRGRELKYFVFAALVLWGLVFLLRLGRPDHSSPRERKRWYPRWVYLITLGVAVLVAGFALGKSPNPMEGVVKVFKAMVGLQPSVWAVVGAFVFFMALAIVGNKLICGWACPFGALQELVYSLPWPKRWKRPKVPFWLSNTVRFVLFAAMLLVLFGVLGGRKGFVLYHLVNPFNLFDLQFETFSILLTVIVALVAGLVVYRPFCQFVCPFGLVSWLGERISLFRVQVDHGRCNGCGSCGLACPTGAAADLVASKALPADCYSCARCLRVCPHEAIAFRSLRSRPSSPVSVAATSSVEQSL